MKLLRRRSRNNSCGHYGILGIPLLVVTLLLIFTPPLHAAITFVYPVEKSRVLRSDYLVLKINNPEITGVRITVNGVDSDLLEIGTPEYRKAFRDFLILQAMWDPGKNSIAVEGFAGGKKLETVRTEIFFQQAREGHFGSATAEGYAIIPFHSSQKEILCAPCHNMNPTAAQSDDSLGKGNPCYGCHSKMINVAYVHGPAGTFSCAYCHSGRDNPRYATPRREAALCAECHVEQVADFKKRKFQHGPVEADLCEICHDPHGTANPSQLKAPINTLCLSCHEEVVKSTHVVQLPSGESHPVGGKPDPSRPGTGRMLSCISCHNPHAGNVRYYFQNNADSRMDLCQMCHNK